jgi:hypothetical protein
MPNTFFLSETKNRRGLFAGIPHSEIQPGEDLLVGNRFRQILDKARKKSV